MPQNYFTLLTNLGLMDWAQAQALGLHLPITHIAVGDGGGDPVTPSENMTELVHERRRVQVTSVSVDSDNPNWLIVETVLPAHIGGWTIREIGMIGGLNPDDPAKTPETPGNKLLAVGNFPDTYKPLLSEGVSKDMAIRIILQVSNASVVDLILDPSVVVATKKNIAQAIHDHEAKPDPHPQYLKRGQFRAIRHFYATSTMGGS